MSPNDRKSTQRERLLAGMVAVANRDGYAGASISKVIAHAGVSRPTFYDYFADRDDCFLATHRDIAERLLAHIRLAVESHPPEQALQAAVRMLLARAEAEPAQAQFMANETMAGGPRALDERDHTIREIENIVERACARTPLEALAPDLPTRAVIGATHWMLSPRLRRGEHDLRRLTDKLIVWIERYERPFGEHRWRTLEPGPTPRQSRPPAQLARHPPAPLPRGRSRLSGAELNRHQRERILFATAELATRKGYTATTIADITTTARVDRRVFYSHFRDKQQAFLAAHELAVQQTLTIAAGAFFSAAEWPERVWQGLLAASRFQASNPTIAHLGYVEAHAVGPPAIQRVDDNHAAFMIFLQEGNRHTSEPLSNAPMEAIVATVFEIGYLQTRRGRTDLLPRVIYHAMYITLTPFLGAQAVNGFIDSKLHETTPEPALEQA
jgi:AcrR family transcriptional regulator